MNKKDFELKVVSVSELPDGWREQAEGGGATISITAWESGEEIGIDQHVTESFPELRNELGLYEEQEGDMYHYESKTKIQTELIDRGFNLRK